MFQAKVKVYGSIPHLTGVDSHVSAGDKKISEGQTKICVSRARDRHDRIIVQEKLDGACVGALRVSETEMRFLTRSGHDASTSPHSHHNLFAEWGGQKLQEFFDTLKVGEMLAGEWMTVAHGIRYEKLDDPFYAFDIIDANCWEKKRAVKCRLPFEEQRERLLASDFGIPTTRRERDPVDPRELHAEWLKLGKLQSKGHPTGEGFVYRVERRGQADFMAKWVQPGMVPGAILFVEKKLQHNLILSDSGEYREMKRISDFYA